MKARAGKLAALAVVLAVVAGVVLILGGSDERVASSASDHRVTEPSAPMRRRSSISATEFFRVREAAIDAAGGGELTKIYRSNDPGEAFEVEVRRAGREIAFALTDDLRRVPDRGRPTDD